MNYKLFKKTWIAIAIFVVYAIVVKLGWLQSLDSLGYQMISSLSSSMMTSIMTTLTFLGSWIAEINVCIICLVLWFHKGIVVSTMVAFGTLVNYIVKFIVQRARPNVIHLVAVSGYSFPSSHATTSFIVYGMLAYLLWKKNKVLAYIVGALPFLIGISRIYVGAHYVSDVLGGYLVGYIFVSFAITWFKNHKKLPEA